MKIFALYQQVYISPLSATSASFFSIWRFILCFSLGLDLERVNGYLSMISMNIILINIEYCSPYFDFVFVFPVSQLHGLDCDRNMVRRPHHLLVSCSGPALVSASSSGTMISAVSPAAHSQITLRGHRVVPAQCSPGHCYGALPQTERHCSLGARQSLLQILLIHQVRSWLIFTRWFQITHSRSRWWWDSGSCVVWNTIISYDKKYIEGMWFKVYMTNAFKGVNHCLKASGRRYLGALLYLAVHHLLSRDNLRVRANDRDLSMSSEIPITNPFLFLENMFQKENILFGSLRSSSKTTWLFPFSKSRTWLISHHSNVLQNKY